MIAGTGRARALAARGVLVAAGLLGACSSPHAGRQIGVWSSGPKIAQDRFEGYGATSGGRVLFLGGISGTTGDFSTAAPSTRVEALDPSRGAWTDAPPLPGDAPKHHLAVAVIGDDVYVVNGFDGILGDNGAPFTPIAKAYVLHAGAWAPLADAPLARGAATAQAIDGIIYVTGGATTEGVVPFGQTYAYDPAANAWTARAPLPTPREHLASCAIGGKMIVVGGWVGPGDVAQHAAEMYDPATDSWEALPPMPTARGGLGAVAVGSQCFAVGGEDWALPLPGTFGVVEVFDVPSRTWSTRAPMPTSRHGLGLALLGGSLYAVGGGPEQGNSYTNVVEILPVE